MRIVFTSAIRNLAGHLLPLHAFRDHLEDAVLAEKRGF